MIYQVGNMSFDLDKIVFISAPRRSAGTYGFEIVMDRNETIYVYFCKEEIGATSFEDLVKYVKNIHSNLSRRLSDYHEYLHKI